MNALLDAVSPSAFAATIRRAKRTTRKRAASTRSSTATASSPRCSADRRVEWALENLPGNHVLTSSFGAQAAVSLHLVTSIEPEHSGRAGRYGLPVPGDLSLHRRARGTYEAQPEGLPRGALARVAGIASRPALESRARRPRGLQSREQGRADAPRSAGPRRQHVVRGAAPQAEPRARSALPYLEWAGGRWKVHPIADWTDRDVHRYLTKHNLPYHPLWEKGYLSIGDHHSTRRSTKSAHSSKRASSA